MLKSSCFVIASFTSYVCVNIQIPLKPLYVIMITIIVRPFYNNNYRFVRIFGIALHETSMTRHK